METMTWEEYLDYLESIATTKTELESIKVLRGKGELKWIMINMI